jgi:hypothetical protein
LLNARSVSSRGGAYIGHSLSDRAAHRILTQPPDADRRRFDRDTSAPRPQSCCFDAARPRVVLAKAGTAPITPFDRADLGWSARERAALS